MARLSLNSCTRDEKPLVIDPIDRRRLEFFVALDVARIRRFAVDGVVYGDIGTTTCKNAKA